MQPTICTISGTYFNFLKPWEHKFTLEEIAHALSHVCRFAGHTREMYTVAQHSVIVSYLCDAADAKHGLMHDGTEAYVGDMTSPLKALLPAYQAIEEGVWFAIADHFKLSREMPPSIKRADLSALKLERRMQINVPHGDQLWEHIRDVEEASSHFLKRVWTPAEARLRFIDRAECLGLH